MTGADVLVQDSVITKQGITIEGSTVTNSRVFVERTTFENNARYVMIEDSSLHGSSLELVHCHAWSDGNTCQGRGKYEGELVNVLRSQLLDSSRVVVGNTTAHLCGTVGVGLVAFDNVEVQRYSAVHVLSSTAASVERPGGGDPRDGDFNVVSFLNVRVSNHSCLLLHNVSLTTTALARAKLEALLFGHTVRFSDHSDIIVSDGRVMQDGSNAQSLGVALFAATLTNNCSVTIAGCHCNISGGTTSEGLRFGSLKLEKARLVLQRNTILLHNQPTGNQHGIRFQNIVLIDASVDIEHCSVNVTRASDPSGLLFDGATATNSTLALRHVDVAVTKDLGTATTSLALNCRNVGLTDSSWTVAHSSVVSTFSSSGVEGVALTTFNLRRSSVTFLESNVEAVAHGPTHTARAVLLSTSKLHDESTVLFSGGVIRAVAYGPDVRGIMSTAVFVSENSHLVLAPEEIVTSSPDLNSHATCYAVFVVTGAASQSSTIIVRDARVVQGCAKPNAFQISSLSLLEASLLAVYRVGIVLEAFCKVVAFNVDKMTVDGSSQIDVQRTHTHAQSPTPDTSTSCEFKCFVLSQPMFRTDVGRVGLNIVANSVVVSNGGDEDWKAYRVVGFDLTGGSANNVVEQAAIVLVDFNLTVVKTELLYFVRAVAGNAGGASFLQSEIRVSHAAITAEVTTHMAYAVDASKLYVQDASSFSLHAISYRVQCAKCSSRIAALVFKDCGRFTGNLVTVSESLFESVTEPWNAPSLPSQQSFYVRCTGSGIPLQDNLYAADKFEHVDRMIGCDPKKDGCQLRTTGCAAQYTAGVKEGTLCSCVCKPFESDDYMLHPLTCDRVIKDTSPSTPSPPEMTFVPMPTPERSPNPALPPIAPPATTTATATATRAINRTDGGVQTATTSYTLSLASTPTNPPMQPSVTPTAPLLQPEEPRNVLPPATQRVAEGTATATAAMAVVSGPSAAVAANRGLVALAAVYCGLPGSEVTPMDEDPGVAESPLQLCIRGASAVTVVDAASDAHATAVCRQAGAVVGNVALLSVVLALLATLTHLGVAQGARVASYLAATVLYVLVQPTVFAAVFLLRHSGSVAAAWLVVCGLAGVGVLGGLVALCVCVHRAGPLYATLDLNPNLSKGDDAEGTPLCSYAVPEGAWSSYDERVGGTDSVALRAPYHHGLGRFHEQFRGSHGWMAVELGFSVVLGVLSALRPTTDGCRALSVVFVLLFAAYAVVVAVFRYFSIAVERVSAVVVAGALLVATAVSAYSVFNGLDADRATAIAYCSVVAEGVAMLSLLVQHAGWALEKFIYKGGLYAGAATTTTSNTDLTDTATDVTDTDSLDGTLGMPLLVHIVDDGEGSGGAGDEDTQL